MGIIYRHTSPSGKSYIGQTKYDSWEKRASANPLKSYENSVKFHKAIVKYGWENFTHEILESNITNLEDRNKAEIFWINFYDSVRNGYNQKIGGYHNSNHKPREKSPSLINKGKIIELYLEGLSLREVGLKVKCSYITVRKVLKENSIPLRGHGTQPSTFKRKIRYVTCIVCQNEFEAKKKHIVSCSRSCSSFIGRAKQLGVTVEELLLRKNLKTSS